MLGINCEGVEQVINELGSVCYAPDLSDCAPVEGYQTAKPLLLYGGFFIGAEDWFLGNNIEGFDSTSGTFPLDLNIRNGFKVYIAHPRGDFPSWDGGNGYPADEDPASRESWS